MHFGKMDIVNWLAAARGYRQFLEIATGTTGLEFASLNRLLFDRTDRLIYNVAEDFQDGSPITYRSSTVDIAACITDMQRAAVAYDIVFVDPTHDYASSRRDIDLALQLVRPGGAIVIHDCLPPSGGDLISPTFVPGSWCGVTFIAYVDVLLAQGLQFQTVDCDYGCGIILNVPARQKPAPGLNDGWQRVRSDPEQALQFLLANSTTLINLVPVSDFVNSMLVEVQDHVLGLRKITGIERSRDVAPGVLHRAWARAATACRAVFRSA